MASPDRPLRRATLAVHGRRQPPSQVSGLSTPIHQSSAFDLDPAGASDGWAYTRLRNPTVESVADRVAGLEGAADAVLFSSGMGAIAATLLALLPPGGRLVAARELYGDAHALIVDELPRLGFRTALVDVDDGEGWERELRGGADVLYVETLSNPMLRVAGLDWLGRLARDAGMAAVVDSTFTSPVNVRPLEHGFDVVVHSATKYLNGHSDLVAGAVAGTAAPVAAIRRRAELLGACLDPHAAFLLERGLRTLPLRMACHNASALSLAGWLEGHPEVEAVRYPLLPSHPDHRVARGLLAGGSGIVTLRVGGGDARAAALIGALRLIRSAPTLGGVESLVSAPCHSSHGALSAAQRGDVGIVAGTLRLSVGIEDLDDLREDLEHALAATARPRRRRPPAEAVPAGGDLRLVDGAPDRSPPEGEGEAVA